LSPNALPHDPLTQVMSNTSDRLVGALLLSERMISRLLVAGMQGTHSPVHSDIH
jgi:hypothetical protein